jgi:glyceraldehyde 3-phosphate dehydrogenase
MSPLVSTPSIKTRIGINGFGRMGRLAVRAAWGSGSLEFAHVNEVKGGPEVAAHLLAFDSVHGKWDHEVIGNEGLEIDGNPIAFSDVAEPGEVPWNDVDIVLEC